VTALHDAGLVPVWTLRADVQEVAYLTACDMEAGRLPGSVGEHFETEVRRAVGRGLRVAEAREAVSAGFAEVFGEAGR